jgi:hypothetical protein
MKSYIFVSILFLLAIFPLSAASGNQSTLDDKGRKLSEQIGPYVLMKYNLPEARNLYRRDEKRRAWTAKYNRVALDEKVCYCIFQLRNESWVETDNLSDFEPYSDDPEATPTRELVKLGRSAIPRLIEAMNCRAETEMSYSRFTRDKYLVQDAALLAIERIACRHFANSTPISIKLPYERQQLRNRVEAWWKENKDSNDVQWAKEVLLSEKPVERGRQEFAIDTLYLRLGTASYPLLVKAYQRFSRPDGEDGANFLRPQIMRWLLSKPTAAARPAFVAAVQDTSLYLKVIGARGLWKLNDSTGLEAIIAYARERSLDAAGPRADEFKNSDSGLLDFLAECDTPGSRDAVYTCLIGRNPYLRREAIRLSVTHRLEKTIRTLPELFEDQFVLVEARQAEKSSPHAASSYSNHSAGPAWRVCDEAVAAFLSVAPEAPRYDGSTEETQKQSIKRLKQWWKVNRESLVWNEKRGVLVLPARTK